MRSTSIRQIVHVPTQGVRLEGAYEAPANAAGLIVFAHGSGSSRMSPRNRYVASELRRHGFATLLFDLLTQQEDWDATQRFDIARLIARLRDAVEWTRQLPQTNGLPIGLFGASTGAAAAVEVAAQLGRGIAAVVSRGGRPDLASVNALQKVTAPTLFIVGGDDAHVIELNEEAYERLRCVKSLQIVPGASHLFEEPGTLELVAALAAEWCLRHLRRISRAA